MKIIIGSDHGGLNLKNLIIHHLHLKNIQVEDIGSYSNENVDFPPYAEKVAKSVAGNNADFGILCCGTGIGMSMAANKIKGIRAAVVSESYSAKYSRLHNDANILCLGQRVIGEGLALEIVDIWLSTTFDGGKHQRRIDLLNQLEH